MWKEFKKFAMKGNVMDMAIAVVIGTAFGKMVDSMVNDLIMPFFGVLVGGINLSTKSITIGQVVVKYGAFLQTMIDFFIIAFSIFLAIRVVNRIRGDEEEEAPSQKEKPPVKDDLIREIRDVLHERLPRNIETKTNGIVVHFQDKQKTTDREKQIR
ncbi:large-conductance mechanosensitive channel protein MscL [Bacillus fonticola]|uniref:large-conductance mechanosensitive channel protein MscL n=1 Tax=Bacillus fonticola TaxID=2728853 RepID=UPI00147318A6|nr:large-conductance mechanosensitive channel protein MscL [Bacillus fonticola]